MKIVKQKEILIATGNNGKLDEMLHVLDGLPFHFLSLQDVGAKIEVKEEGMTHEENAMLKARAYFNALTIPTIGEDSGIWVDALHNELGIHTRRWGAGERASDKEWLEFFLKRMGTVPENERGATFVSVVAFADSDGVRIFRGETHGRITPQCEAPLVAGIPLSSCFIPDGADKVYSALSPDEKNHVSHRGRAMRKLREFFYSSGRI